MANAIANSSPGTAVTSTDPLQGPTCLSPKSLHALGRVGAYLEAFEPGKAPSAYTMHEEMQANAELGSHASTDIFAYRGLVRHVEYLARRGLSADQIADRFALSRLAIKEASVFLPDMRAALRGGLAEGVEQAANTVHDRIALGDVQAASFLLKTKGGFVPPSNKAPAVQINLGSTAASVEISDIDAMKQRQTALMDSVDYSELD